MHLEIPMTPTWLLYSALYLFFLSSGLTFHVARASCGCGFTVNETTAPSYALFTDLLETDFLHIRSIPNDSLAESPKTDIGWSPQVYNASASASRGPYGKNAQLRNVVANPLVSSWDWGGEGILGGDPGLQIWVRSRLTEANIGSQKNLLVSMGELVSIRDDMLYGSFRIGMKASQINGTCGAFFWFRNDTSEIDLEFLSSQLTATNDTGKINLVIQTPLSAALGYNAAPTQDFKLYSLPFSPSNDYHEYRFDWTSERIDFYVDGTYIWTLDHDIPDGPGRLFINHWANGDPTWSGGPPTTDAVLTISYVKAYFNSSNHTRSAEWHKDCGAATMPHGIEKWPYDTCVVPDIGQGGSISPTGPNGNATGRTTFLTCMPDSNLEGQTLYPAANASYTSAAARTNPGIFDRSSRQWKGLNPTGMLLLTMATVLDAMMMTVMTRRRH